MAVLKFTHLILLHGPGFLALALKFLKSRAQCANLTENCKVHNPYKADWYSELMVGLSFTIPDVCMN